MTTDRDRAGDVAERTTNDFDRDAGHSNYMAFLLGGLMISVGLLAFMFYDNGARMGRDVTITGSVTPPVEQPASPSAGNPVGMLSGPSSPAAPQGRASRRAP